MDLNRTSKESILALGNPNLKNPALNLHHAEQEVLTLSSLFPDMDILTANDATETAFLQRAPEVDILHLACHGELNLEEPMLTSLRLTPDVINDGYLHAGEIFDLDLNASLVVLSACETAVGKQFDGNELMGLTRSFMYAGAPAVVASLWKVDDRSTAVLMEAFYRNLQTMNKAEALRQAKLTTMKEFPEPFHWAAFTLQGDYR
jgi:CHAT domain-containing protein